MLSLVITDLDQALADPCLWETSGTGRGSDQLIRLGRQRKIDQGTYGESSRVEGCDVELGECVGVCSGWRDEVGKEDGRDRRRATGSARLEGR